MRITVYYENGLTEDFDTMNFTMSEPFKAEGSKNILTDFQLRFDYLMSKGLLLDVYYYDAVRDSNTRFEAVEELGVEIPVATRRLGWRVQLVSKEELDSAVLILRDNEMFAWKQGDEWINAVKFRLQEILCFSSASTDSTNRKATVLFAYLRKAHPTLTDEEVAGLMGFSLEAYRAIQEWETENMDFEDPIPELEQAINQAAAQGSEDMVSVEVVDEKADPMAHSEGETEPEGEPGGDAFDDESDFMLEEDTATDEIDFSSEEGGGFEFEDDE